VIHKPFDQIDKVDIESLVDNAVEEGRTIEYKQALPGNADKDKKEFLADVSSFANAAGGDLLYGVEEARDAGGQPTGIPASTPGLAIPNEDTEIRRLENIIRDGIRPRIAGIHMQAVGGFANGPVLLARIPKSYAAPHMVTFQEHSRFYSRNSKGKYPLDVGEIRVAFALSESLPERIRSFRTERLARIIADETPMPLRRVPILVLHIIPVV
jgi:predicted HTH transcriptional regulator